VLHPDFVQDRAGVVFVLTAATDHLAHITSRARFVPIIFELSAHYAYAIPPNDAASPPVSTRKIDDLLDEGHRRFSPLQRLLKTSSNQKQWTAELRALVDPSLRHEVDVTDIKGNHAHVLCRSAAVATHLRFASPELLPQLRTLASFARVEELKLRVSSSAGQ